jgi:hypothetical protein
MVRYKRRLSLMGSILFFLGGKNIVYPMCQSSFVKLCGNQNYFMRVMIPHYFIDNYYHYIIISVTVQPVGRNVLGGY